MHQMPPSDADTILAVALAEDFSPRRRRVPTLPAKRSLLKPVTRSQAKRIRELVEDEGWTLTEARSLATEGM